MIDFAITSPHLRQLTVYGASKIATAENQVLAQPTLTLNLNGAAEADLHLNVQTLTIDAKGASKLDLEGQANQAHITIAGAGELVGRILVALVFSRLIGFEAVCFAAPAAWLFADIPLAIIYLKKRKELIKKS